MEVVANQPVSILVDAGGAFMFYSSGVLTKLCGGHDDHAILIVGYGTDAASGKDYWKVKNSWGPANWGEGGYGRLVRNHNGEGTLDFVTLGGFLKYSDNSPVHGFLEQITYTDTGSTANGDKVYGAYYGSANTNYLLYKCTQGVWMVTDSSSFDSGKCSGYAYSPANAVLTDKPKGWQEINPNTKAFVATNGGVVDAGTVKSECGLLKMAVYPTVSASKSIVV